MTAGRRQVHFGELGDVLVDLENLLRGHRTVGRWDLGQICSHLTLAFTCTLDGFPPGTLLPGVVQKTAGKLLLALVLSRGRIVEGVKIPRAYLPSAGRDPREEADRLAHEIARFSSAGEALTPHPLFGRLTHEQWRRYHCIHCAHHLSFAVPDQKISPGS